MNEIRQQLIFDLGDHEDFPKQLIINKIIDKSIFKCSQQSYIHRNRKEIPNLLDLNLSTKDIIITNPITLTNVKISDNKIIGDINIKSIFPHKYDSTPKIDLLQSDYKLVFQPNFVVSFGETENDLIMEEMNSFSVYLLDIQAYREERLSKLLSE